MSYTPIPDAVIDDERLDASMLAVLIAIRSYAWTLDGGCTAAIAKIAKRARCGKSTVKRAIVRLKAIRYITQVVSQGRNDRHQLPNKIILTPELYAPGVHGERLPGVHSEYLADQGFAVNPPGVHRGPQIIQGETNKSYGLEQGDSNIPADNARAHARESVDLLDHRNRGAA